MHNAIHFATVLGFEVLLGIACTKRMFGDKIIWISSQWSEQKQITEILKRIGAAVLDVQYIDYRFENREEEELVMDWVAKAKRWLEETTVRELIAS